MNSDDKTHIKRLWDKTERYAIYTVVFVVLLAQILTYFIPRVGSLIDQRAAIIVFCLAFILLFKDIDRYIVKQNRSGIVAADGFVQGMDALLQRAGGTIESMEIMAQTTMTYCHAIENSSARIDTLRILVNRPVDIGTKHFPTSADELRKFERERDSALLLWHDLVDEGRIGRLEIRCYDFDPTLHFCIVNSRYVHFGLYRPRESFPGYRLYTIYGILGGGEVEASLIADCRSFFDDVYSRFSYGGSGIS